MSKYTSVNELDTFMFHDAVFRKIDTDGRNLVWQLGNVCVKTQNSQNDLASDMQAGPMSLTFYDCTIDRIINCGSNYYSADGRLTGSKPGWTYSQDEYPGIFETLVNYSGVISGLKESPGYSSGCAFDILTPFEGITLWLSYSKAEAHWETFEKQAWYLKYKKPKL